MKNVTAIIAAAGCLAAASTSFAAVAAGTGVNGSLHDMTKVVSATADKMGRVCVFCHTPHNAIVASSTDAGADRLPLWNHNLPSGTFSPYQWASIDNKFGGLNGGDFTITDPLAGPSRLCMSCHDGSIAIDEHGRAMSEIGRTPIGSVNQSYDGLGRSNLSKDLATTHPIGFDYNVVAASRNARAHNGTGSLNTAGKYPDGTEIVVSTKGYATAVDSAINDIKQGFYNPVTRDLNGKTIADNLFGGNIMTCATCHEVHNKENATQDDFTDNVKRTVLGTQQSAPNYFLYAKEKDSLICLSCHVK